MANYNSNGETFINPYNFVSVDLSRTPRKNILEEQATNLTGYISCKLITKTPLAIPDVEHVGEDNIKHKKYPFMKIDGQCVIPGSSIRGEIRNVYETITDSCFGTMKENTLITARSQKAFSNIGVLKRDDVTKKWNLYKGERYLVVMDSRFKDRIKDQAVAKKIESNCKTDIMDGTKVYFSISNEGYTKQPRKGKPRYIGTYVREFNVERNSELSHIGFFYKGEEAPKRHFWSIIEVKGNPIIKDVDLYSLDTIIDVYQDETINKKCKKEQKWYRNYNLMKKRGLIPVYYMMGQKKKATDKDILYMSPAAIGRKAFYNSLNKIVEEKNPQKCTGRNNLCPACALFGTIEGDKLSSRIRFTDAWENSGVKLINNVVMEELGSPRSSYLPFYLKNKTGDNIVDWSQGYDSDGLTIRGRKYYFHYQPNMKADVRKTNRNATFDLAEGEFVFRVYFENISEEQLKLLCTTITLGDNSEDSRLYHKLGHGKPLGFGSAKIIINEIYQRTFSLEDGWKETSIKEQYANVNEHLCGDQTYMELLKIHNWDTTKGSKVSYPKVVKSNALDVSDKQIRENILASHKWFSDNYQLGKEPKNTLPEIMKTNLTMNELVLVQIEERDKKVLNKKALQG